MDPLQRLAAHKRHPLQATTKVDKNQPKGIRLVKPAEQVKPVKEEQPIDKSAIIVQSVVKIEEKEVIQTPPQSTVQKVNPPQVIVKIQQLPVISQQLPPEIKIEEKVVQKQSKEIPQQQKKEQILVKTEVNILTEVPPVKTQPKAPPKDILAQSKLKNPLAKPESTITHPKPKETIKKQQPIIKIKEKQHQPVPVPAPLPTPIPPPKQQQKIENIKEQDVKLPQIGEKAGRRQVKKHLVRVEVDGTSQKSHGLLKTTYYHIKGHDEHGSFAANRKYEEFQALNTILHERWPGCFLPALSKQTEGKKEAEREKHLRATLSNYLLGLSYSSHLYYREEVQLFLRSPDLDASEMFHEMPPLKTRDVISRLRSSFGELLDQPATPLHAARITGFIATLRKILGSLGTLASRALILSEAYEEYWQGLGRFSKVQRAYEQLWASQRGAGGAVARQGQHRLDRLQELTPQNPFDRLYSFLSSEARDAQAFLQVIIASDLFLLRKEDLEREVKELQGEIQGVMLGKASLRTMTSRKGKEQVQAELQTKQKRLSEQRETMVEMYSILQILLAARSIPQFQEFKRDTYRSIVEEWASLGSQAIPQLQALWQFVAEQTKTHQ